MAFVATDRWPSHVPGGGKSVKPGDVVEAEGWANRDALLDLGWIRHADSSELNARKTALNKTNGKVAAKKPATKAKKPAAKKPAKKATKGKSTAAAG